MFLAGAPMEAEARPEPTPQSRVGAGLSTGRKLWLACCCVLVSLILAFALLTWTWERIDRTVDSMEGGDEEVDLALQIGSSIHEQYGREGQFVLENGEGLPEYEEAHQRTLALLDRLAGRATDTSVLAALTATHQAVGELDRVFRTEVVPGVRGASVPVSLARQRSYPLVVAAQNEMERAARRLQASIADSRGKLTVLEADSVRWLATGLAVTALLFAGVVVYLSRSIARPLALLSKGAAVLASGNLDHRIAIEGPGEFGALAADMNAMAVSLKEHQRRLVESEKDAIIGRVAAGIAHEISNPLQAMLGYLSLNRDHHDERLTKHLVALEEETVRCKQIVDGMLELSRPEVALDFQPLDLRPLCDDIAKRLQPLCLLPKVRVRVSGDASALADRLKLRQALLNVMKNAVEAAGFEGEVDVRISESENWSQVRVGDTGPGIPFELRARLFEPLFTTKETGTGLGLAVSRAIVRAHGGDIDAWNSDRKGAVFVMRLLRASVQNGRNLS